jgi:hypothetical protein
MDEVPDERRNRGVLSTASQHCLHDHPCGIGLYQNSALDEMGADVDSYQVTIIQGPE